MAIVKMNRFTLLTFERHKQPLLKALQAFEHVHFRRLQADDFEGYETIKRNTDNAALYENHLARVTYAADRLKPFAELPAGLKALTTPATEMTFDELDRFTEEYDHTAVCAAVQTCDERLKAIQAEQTRLKTETDNLRLWSNMDVAPSELDRLKSIRYQIGSVNKNALQAFIARTETMFPHAYIETLHAVKDDVVFFIAAPAGDWDGLAAEIKNAGFTRSTLNFTVLPAEKIRENTERAEALQKEAEAARTALASHASQYDKLMIAADYFRTALERARACENFMNLSDVLVMEGWFPAEDSARLNRILNDTCHGEYYLEAVPVESDAADVPIQLKNNKVVSAFEDITSMFSLPRYNEIDPTPILMPFYWLFFGLMVGDAGYGLILVIGTALALRFLNFSSGMKKFLQFFFYLGFSTILAGCLYGSAFGIPFFTPLTGPDGAPKAILDSQLDITMMLVLSIAVGTLQVLYGLGVKGYMLIRDGKVLDAVFDSLFWIIALVSGISWILVFAGFLPGSAGPYIQWTFFGSLLALAATQGRSSPTVVGKVASGLYSVYGITGYVGDLVSYTRLVALSLSGAYIAFSFNMMAGLMPGVMKYIAGLLIAVLGQTINLGLSLLGAYVHSCRLQYVEFFGKFYEGGGVPFKPLSPRNVFVQIKKQENII